MIDKKVYEKIKVEHVKLQQKEISRRKKSLYLSMIPIAIFDMILVAVLHYYLHMYESYNMMYFVYGLIILSQIGFTVSLTTRGFAYVLEETLYEPVLPEVINYMNENSKFKYHYSTNQDEINETVELINQLKLFYRGNVKSLFHIECDGIKMFQLKDARPLYKHRVPMIYLMFDINKTYEFEIRKKGHPSPKRSYKLINDEGVFRIFMPNDNDGTLVVSHKLEDILEPLRKDRNIKNLNVLVKDYKVHVSISYLNSPLGHFETLTEETIESIKKYFEHMFLISQTLRNKL